MKRRNTAGKDAVLQVLHESQKAMSQDSIIRQMDLGIDRATIYRILNRFCEDGLIHKIVAEDGKQYFALCHDCTNKMHRDYHFHFRCQQCDSIECLQENVHFSLPKGYRVESVNCLLTGICPQCA